MSSEELKKRLKEEAEHSEKNARVRKQSALQERRQQKISEQTKKQLPPQSPVRKKREEEQRKQEKQAARARKRRKKRGSYIVYYVILGVIIVVVFAILSTTVFFNTEQIIVEGESDYTDEQIIAASELKGDENLVRLNTSDLPKRILDKLATLDSVKVDKVFPHTIKITVERSVPMVNFLYNGKYYVISHIGRVMQISDTAGGTGCMQVIGYVPATSVVAGAFITAEDPEQDKLISEISRSCEKNQLSDISAVDITDSIGIVLTYQDRIKIFIGSIIDIDQKTKIAHELITGGYIGETEYVTLDISDPSKARQRPITTTAINVAPMESTPQETDENGNPVTTEEKPEVE